MVPMGYDMELNNDINSIISELEKIAVAKNNLQIQIENLVSEQKMLEEKELNLNKRLNSLRDQLYKDRIVAANPSIKEGSLYYNGYNSGYEDERWKAKKELILKRDNYKCQMCNGIAQEVHHINYWAGYGVYVGEEVWKSPNMNLVSLCHSCHSEFDKTYCKHTIFIPSVHPIKISKPIIFAKDKEIENPSWREVSIWLRKMRMYYNDDIEKNLYLVLLAPEYTVLGREILFGHPKCGLNELEKVKLSYRYQKRNSLLHIIDNIKEYGEICPSTKKNVDYLISELVPILDNCVRPSFGIIPIASRNKKRGYYISLFDISNNGIVKVWDLSSAEEYIKSTGKEPNKLAILYAIKYVYELHIETGLSVYDLPIFPNDNNGSLPLYSRYAMEEWKHSLLDEGIDKMMKEIAETIDFSEFYLCHEWNTEEWGDIPTLRLRATQKKAKSI